MSTPTPKAKPVEILHLAMPRTGSLSMMSAYRILGYTTYHGFDFISSLPHQRLWDRAIEGKQGRARAFTDADWNSEAFLGPYQVLSDYPALAFSAEFLDMWPEAKVVLVERDIEKWNESFQRQVVPAPFTWKARFLVNCVDPWVSARPASTIRKCMFPDFECYDEASFSANAVPTYKRHYEWVKSVVPKERLLVYRLGEGWGSLCDFLGKKVPEEKFPWLNESKEFEIWMRKVQTKAVKTGLAAMGRALVIPVVVVLVAWVLRRLWC